MSTKAIKIPGVSSLYKEESIKVPVAITLVTLLLICTPLVMWIMKINNEGFRSTDITNYDALISMVENDVRTVDAMLRNDAEELKAIQGGGGISIATLDVPEVVLVDENTGLQKINPLKVSLDGIYWSATNPLISIDDNTYGVGDMVQGYEIVRIGKTAVQFRSSDGTIVVKDMYEDLLNVKR